MMIEWVETKNDHTGQSLYCQIDNLKIWIKCGWLNRDFWIVDTLLFFEDGWKRLEAKTDEEAKQEAIKSVLSELRKWVAAFESAC